MNAAAGFWTKVDTLVAQSAVRIDRPKGSVHHPDFVYPLDHGYLTDTQGGDGDGIDVWIGSLPERQVVGVVGTVDLGKGDMELKVLLGCTAVGHQIVDGRPPRCAVVAVGHQISAS